MRVVVPAGHAEETLGRCLAALANSVGIKASDIYVADDGGNGDLDAARAAFGVTVVSTGGARSAANARNCGAAGYDGDILVFVDSDVEVRADAIERLVAPIRSGVAHATVGNYSTDTTDLDFCQAYKQLYLWRVYSRRRGFIRNHFWSALGAVDASTFAALGGFASQIAGTCEEDTELGQRMTSAGVSIMAVPEAVGKHIKPSGLRQLILNDFRKGMTTVPMFLRSNVALTDNRHASPRDILSVSLACTFLASLPVSALAPTMAVSVAACSGLLYLGARADLLATFAKPGLLFLIRAAPLMYALDIVRGVCMSAGLAWLACRWIRGQPGLPAKVAAPAVRKLPAPGPGRLLKAVNRARAGLRLMSPGIQLPVYLIVYTTSHCDARCAHCFYWRDLNHVRDELSVDEYDRLSRSIGPVLQVTLTGGSPELRRDLPEIARRFYTHCRPVNMTLCMLGSHTGRVVTQVEEILKTCPGQRVTVGLSLDGLGEEHDVIRGCPGLFGRVVATFRELGQLKKAYHDLTLHAAITISTLNHSSAEHTARWAHQNLPIDGLKPILVRGAPADAAVVARSSYAPYLRLVAEERSRNVHFSGGHRSFLSTVIETKERVERDLIERIIMTSSAPVACSGARETAVIYPDGKVAGCELRDEVMGYLRETGMALGPIWFSSKAARFRNTAGQAAACKGCYHHCFISPAMFRTPALWPKLARTFVQAAVRGSSGGSP